MNFPIKVLVKNKFKLILWVLFIFIFQSDMVFGFTLVPSRLKFNTNRVPVFVAQNSCVNNSLTTARLHGLVEEALQEFWNQVPTSAMRLKLHGVYGAVDTSNDTLGQALAKAPNGAILVGCSQNTSIFDDASILGVGSIAQKSNGDIVGALLINDALISGENRVASLPDSELRAVFAHEIGHALGIGHSGNKIALMYYAIGEKVQERLSQDDYDALTYLYPNRSPGGCGLISMHDDDWGMGMKNFLYSLILGIFMALLVVKILTRLSKNNSIPGSA